MTRRTKLRPEERLSAVSFRFSEPTAAPEPDYSAWFRENVLNSRGLTLFAAFYVHWIVIITLAAIFIHAPIEFRPVTLDAVFSDPETIESSPAEFVNLELNTAISAVPNFADESSSVMASTTIPVLSVPAMDHIPDALAAMATQAASTSETQSQSSKELTKPHVPEQPAGIPRNAVTAGSFSVWTVPENPDPGEPYKIVVQIRLPDGTEKYAVSDLDGVVIGSDGYQKHIPGNIAGFLPVQDGYVRLEVHIVSADANVQDTVFVRSKVLREAHKLQLQF